jgi:mannose-6-phosphate isomerase-like protein (cupin superfamily)
VEAIVIRPDRGREVLTPERCHILEMSNSAADEALSVARARVEPGVTTAWHRVQGTAERYVILEGSGEVELGGRPPEAVGPGDVVLIPPGREQRITNSGDEDLVFLALCTPRFQDGNYEAVEPVSEQ